MGSWSCTSSVGLTPSALDVYLELRTVRRRGWPAHTTMRPGRLPPLRSTTGCGRPLRTTRRRAGRPATTYYFARRPLRTTRRRGRPPPLRSTTRRGRPPPQDITTGRDLALLTTTRRGRPLCIAGRRPYVLLRAAIGYRQYVLLRAAADDY